MKKVIFMFIIMLGLSFLFIINVNASINLTCEYTGNNASLKIILKEYGVTDSAIKIYNSDNSFYVDSKDFIDSLKSCPQTIYYACVDDSDKCIINSNALNYGDVTGSVSFKNKNITSSGTNKFTFGESIFSGNNAIGSCEGYFGSANNPDDLMYILKNNIFKPIRILVPIVLVILTSFDFVQAIFNDKKEGMPKATSNFIKRAIIALLIFFAPDLLSLILTLIDASVIKSCLGNF